MKLFGALYTNQDNSVHVLCHLLSLHCQRGGKNMGGVGHSRPINETILVCRVIGNVHTVAGVYWCVVGGEYELGLYADGDHIVVYAGSVHVKMLFGVLGEQVI